VWRRSTASSISTPGWAVVASKRLGGGSIMRTSSSTSSVGAFGRQQSVDGIVVRPRFRSDQRKGRARCLDPSRRQAGSLTTGLTIRFFRRMACHRPAPRKAGQGGPHRETGRRGGPVCPIIMGLLGDDIRPHSPGRPRLCVQLWHLSSRWPVGRPRPAGTSRSLIGDLR